MTTTKIEITLQQMLQMALGVPKITNINISILQSFLNIILNKLDSKYEKVEIGGLEAACLPHVLRLSKISPLHFLTEESEKYEEKLEKLNSMETRVDNVNFKFDKHLESIRECNKKSDTVFTVKNWERFSKACEDLCAIPDAQMVLGCKLVTNFDYIKKLQKRIVDPLMERMEKISSTVIQLHVDFLEFKRLANRKYEHIQSISSCLIQLQKIHEKIDRNRNSFALAMEELQEMLDAKVDRISLPALKKFMHKELEEVHKFCGSLRKEKDICPKTTGVGLYYGASCISCEGNLCCEHRPIFIQTEQECPPQVVKHRKYKSSCSKWGPCLTKNQRVQLLRCMDAEYKQTKQGREDQELRKSCLLPPGDFAVFKGTDGNYYRAD